MGRQGGKPGTNFVSDRGQGYCGGVEIARRAVLEIKSLGLKAAHTVTAKVTPPQQEVYLPLSSGSLFANVGTPSA